MRTKEIEMNQTFNSVNLGDITVVRQLYMDTTNGSEAKEFAEEYARQNGLKVFSIYIGLNPWFTKKTGRYALLYKA